MACNVLLLLNTLYGVHRLLFCGKYSSKHLNLNKFLTWPQLLFFLSNHIQTLSVLHYYMIVGFAVPFHADIICDPVLLGYSVITYYKSSVGKRERLLWSFLSTWTWRLCEEWDLALNCECGWEQCKKFWD